MWLPGYQRWDLPGVPGWAYDESDDPKALLHTTEGSSIEGAVAAYKAYPPHLIVDPVKRRKVQHVDLDRAAYALWNADADDSRCIQVEIVGFASQTHLWSDDTLKWLGEELARPLHEYAGVPYVVVPRGFRRDGETGYALASDSSPLRLTQYELDTFSGFLGHQHIPGDSHWDPGGLNVSKILAYAAGQTTKEDNVAIAAQTFPAAQKRLDGFAVPPVGGSLSIPKGSGEAWLHMRCPRQPVTVHGMWFVRADGSYAQVFKEFQLPQDTYNEQTRWRLPDSCTQVTVEYSGDVPIFALLETKAV